MLDALLRGAGMFLDHEARQDSIAAQRENVAANMRQQMELARHGIRMRVEDAKESGIHPLYAIGAPSISWTPVPVGGAPATDYADQFGKMGQDLTRAFAASESAPAKISSIQRAQQTTSNNLDLENKKLRNDLLKIQIQKATAPGNPPGVAFPVAEGKGEDNPSMMIGGSRVAEDPGWSPAKTAADRWGDESLATNAYGNIRAIRDLYRTYVLPGLGAYERMREQDQWNKYLFGGSVSPRRPRPRGYY